MEIQKNRPVVFGAVQPSGKDIQPSGQAIQPDGRQGFASKISPERKLLLEALRR